MSARTDAGHAGDTGRMPHELRHDAEELARSAKERGRSMLEQQKQTVARQVESVGSAFRSAASELQGEGESQAGRYVGLLADRLESLGGQLRQKNVDGLIREAEGLGRRSPAAFFAGAVAAGFMLTRFLKSSARHPEDAVRRQHGETASRSRQSQVASGSMSGGDTASGVGGARVSGMADYGMDAGVVGGRPTTLDPEGTTLHREARWGDTGMTSGSTTPITTDATTTPSSTGAFQPGGNIHGNR